MRGAAALVLGGFLASCSHDEVNYSTYVADKMAAYQEVFVDAYGQIDPNQNWGFGPTTNAASRMTRALRKGIPEAPTFRDTVPFSRPVVPNYSDTVPSTAHYAKDYQNYQTGDVLYIDGSYSSLNNPQNTEGLTIYADGTVTYTGSTNQNGNGTTICVTQGSTLTLSSVANNLTVYLAPGATLNLPENATFQNAHAALYMSSGSQVNATNLQFTNSTKILNAGGTITASTLTLDQGNTLWNEGTITVTNAVTCKNTDDMIFNATGKTITAGRFDLINNNALLYNNGTATTTGEIKLHNSNAEIINNGALSGAVLNMAAGGKMHNVGTTTITGKTDLTNSNSKWMNDGQYTSGSFDVDNYSKQNYNNCRLTVTGNFHLNRGEFVLNADASVVTASFTWEDTSNFWMNSRSLLKVTGQLLTKNANSNYGFRGVGEQYAVIQAGSIAIESNEQFRMSYFGNLYVDTPTHFGQWYKDAPNTAQPCYYHDATVKFSFTDSADAGVVATAAPVSIPTTGCSPGYGSQVQPETVMIPIDQGETSEDLITVVTTNEYYETRELVEQGRVFCEDLGKISTNDLDFNDVVFDAYIYKVTPSTRTIITEDGVTVHDETVAGTPVYKTTIVLLAAGGTLPLSVAGSEVHNVMGGNSSTTIINTIENVEGSYGNSWVTQNPVVLGTEFTYESIVEIPIYVQYSNGTTLLLEAEQGWAPHKILTPIGTKWAKERIKVDDAYTDFHKYVEYSEDCWNQNFVSTNLYSHPRDTYQPLPMTAVTTLLSTEGPTTTYRAKGTSTTTGGYEGEEVLSRKLR